MEEVAVDAFPEDRPSTWYDILVRITTFRLLRQMLVGLYKYILCLSISYRNGKLLTVYLFVTWDQQEMSPFQSPLY